MTHQHFVQEQIITRALKEEAYRQELLGNPKAAIEGALGISVPAGVTIVVHQDMPTTLHLVLPLVNVPSPALADLSDAELEQAVGGLMPTSGSNRMACIAL